VTSFFEIKSEFIALLRYLDLRQFFFQRLEENTSLQPAVKSNARDLLGTL